VGGLHRLWPLGGHDRARDLAPHLESLPHLVSVVGGREEVTPRSKVLGDGTIRGEEALGLSGGLKPLHPPLPLARGLMRILGTVVQIAMLPMFHTRDFCISPEKVYSKI
jgi:hypothetical protein